MALAGAGCREEPSRGGEASAAPKLSASAAPKPSASAAAVLPPRRDRLVLLAGGDVSLGRLVGQILLREPERELFSTLTPWLSTADVRFANLESQLSDQKGETQKPTLPLVFTGPPGGADALARAGFSVVSTANNHAWDYGKAALFETMDNLERVGIAYAGTGRDRAAAYRPVILDRDGFRLAMIAVTDIWNQGPLATHPGAEYVAEADEERLASAVRALRADATVAAIAVSYHGGSEYIDEPLKRTTRVLRAAIDAGADVVIGHHPHVIQGVEWRAGRPILYSLGNLLMRMHRDYPWTELGYMARIELVRGAPPRVEACPYRIFGITPLPLYREAHREVYERRFFDHLGAISKRVGGTALGPPGPDGCAPLAPP
jgi:poly-gamma-glutamate synthesis protein (capsule biosynthesis protein)